MTRVRPRQPFNLSTAPPAAGKWNDESTWPCENKEVLLFAWSFMGWQLRKSLPLILSFEGIKQAALMGGNAALKILSFVSKVFLLLLLGQVQ